MNRLIALAALIGLAALGVVGVNLRRTASAAAAGQEAPPAPATAKVQRRDLVQRETLDGTLGYAGTRAVTARAAGTITWIAKQGSTVTRGQPLFAVDNRRTYLMYGKVPAYRTLSRSAEDGPDIRQLERNLVALGYADPDEMSVDDDFTSATREAVEDWQDDLGIDDTGKIELGQVVFSDTAVRVGAHKLTVGNAVGPGGVVLEISQRAMVVTVALDAAQADLVAPGERVRVELPDGQQVQGRIADVGSVATTNADGETTVEVTVTLPRAAAAFDQAPVDVHVAASAARGVLAVPVTALLALSEGGYAVEVVESGRRRLVGVELGSYADGLVEVRAAGLKPGMSVVVAE